ncbi:uncharacterized protein LOC120079578 isoform X2 [Benincasa hispida]|uniref:uncharacterized protein LOC120079578 isoform X2 n=1 Tax=Benincasa hispida TaxID=102211 RepID=UPI0019005219|nr:uncharacterized protein LOC120079578 isoform X2 [Benincasa hispida]
MELRQCTTSVLEALMGFDERQPQHHAPRHSEVLSDDYLQRVASIGISKKKYPSRCHPFRMTVEEPTELFNSFKVENNFSRCNELWEWEKADSSLSAGCMPLTRHTIMTEKHFSTGKVIQTSKDFQNLPEVLDSMDISPRPTRGKNSIFNQAKNGPSVSKEHYSSTERNNDAGTKLKDRKLGQTHSSEDLDFLKSSRPLLEWRDKLCFSSSSPTSLRGSHLVNDKCKDCLSSQNGKNIAQNGKNIAKENQRTMEYALQPIKQSSQVSSILDESRRTTRHGFVNLHLKNSRLGTIYDDVCRNETKYRRNSSPSLSNWTAKYKHSCFFSVESYKARESREKVTEEQRKTENLLPSTQGRQMNEMPTLPHFASLPSDLNCKPVKFDFQKHVCSNKEHFHSGSPLCLSWKVKRLDQLCKNSHRLRFDSTSAVTTRSRTRSRYEALRNTWFLKHEGPGAWLQCKPSNRSSNKKDASEPSLKLSSKKLKIFPCPDSASDHVDNDDCMVGDDLKTKVEKKDHCDQHSLNCLSPRSKGVFCTQNIPVKQGNQATSIQQEGLPFEHYPSKEQDSIVSLEEAFQPSPVSVLEPLFKDETLFSSESPGINDLMMQLELLMSDSPGTNSEGHDLFVSSDDDGGEGSICSSNEIDDIMSTFKFKDSRDFSYLVDVLSEASLHCKSLETGSVSCHNQEHQVISPAVFETLEKKFGEQNSWRRSERKLLFDRINSGLVELFQSFDGVPEWAKPVSRRFRPLLNHEMIEEELWILLDSQEREVNKDLVDKQFGKEIGWIDLGDEIDSICRELERLLVNELVAEFGSIELF